MIDPLAEIVALLQPAADFAKMVSAAGPWRVRRSDPGQPFYCLILEGACHLTVGEDAPRRLNAGDFVLIPAAYDFSASSLEPAPMPAVPADPVQQANGEFRLGRQSGPVDVRMLIGHSVFEAPDASLLVSLLPRLVLVSGEPRLTTLVKLLIDESRARRPAREMVLARLLEVLFIEALRANEQTGASPGLLRGLADERLATAIRRLHENPAHPWTVAQLAREAALSRSAFFERFRDKVGIAPMAYLLAWRMALAKDLLRKGQGAVSEVAERVGYSSASTFSVAFARHVGVPPARYARG